MSNSLDPDQARRFVGPDLGPNCLPRLSAEDTGRQRVKVFYDEFKHFFDAVISSRIFCHFNPFRAVCIHFVLCWQCDLIHDILNGPNSLAIIHNKV